MAAVADSDITIVRSWVEGGVSSKERRARLVRVVFTANGDTVGDLTATQLGLTEVEEVSVAQKSDNAAVAFLTPTYARTGVLTFADGAVTPAALTGTYQFVVKGS